MSQVAIRGDGVAASCCAYLLNRAGFSVSLERVDRPRLPAIMLSDHAVALIRDVFGRPELFRGAPRIRKRVVAWGPDAKVLAVDHSAVVVSEESLLADISPGTLSAEFSDWTIFASRPLPSPVEEHAFGSRKASAIPVTLQPASEPATCWIESLADGWLFLIPGAPGSAWLLAVGGPSEELLDRSTVIVKQIGHANPGTRQFPAYPRIVSPLAAPGWLACGTAAMSFDPLCGDGTAHAVREAILASAVIRAAPNEEILAHYEARLTAGFERHLVLCREFYQSGASGPWWNRELESIEEGIAWCHQRLTAHGQFRFQLRDFELHSLS